MVISGYIDYYNMAVGCAKRDRISLRLNLNLSLRVLFIPGSRTPKCSRIPEYLSGDEDITNSVCARKIRKKKNHVDRENCRVQYSQRRLEAIRGTP